MGNLSLERLDNYPFHEGKLRIVPFIGIYSSKKSVAPTDFPCTMSAVARPFYYTLSTVIFLTAPLSTKSHNKDGFCFYQPMCVGYQ